MPAYSVAQDWSDPISIAAGGIIQNSGQRQIWICAIDPPHPDDSLILVNGEWLEMSIGVTIRASVNGPGVGRLTIIALGGGGGGPDPDPVAPAITTAPTITGDTSPTGTLTLTPGTASGTPTPARVIAWLYNGSALPGETGLTLDKAGRVGAFQGRVTWTNSAGNAVGTSNTITTAAEVPAGDLITTDPDATLSISPTGNGEERAVTLASTTHGSFTRTYANAAALTEALAEGPIYFGGLKVNGIPKSGNTVTGQNGLWLYDDNHGAVAFTREWPVNGVPLAGQNGPSLVMDSTMLNTVGYRQIVTQGALPPVAATSPLVPIRLVTTFDAPQNTRLGTFADEFGQQFSTVSGDNLGAYILPNKTVTGNGNLWLVRRTAQDFGSRQYAEGYFIQSNAALDNHSGLGLVLCVNPTAKTALMVSLNIRDNAFGPAESILVHSVSWATGSFVRTYLGSVGTPSESWVDANQRLTLLAEYDNGPLRLFADGSLMGTIDVASGLTGGAGLARVVGPASPSLLSVQIDNFACGVLT